MPRNALRIQGRLAAGAALLSFAVTGCREAAVSYYEVPHEDRVASSSPPAGMPGAAAGPASATAAGRPTGAQLEWDKPAAWTEQPASQMRLASYLFTAPDGAQADVSVFVFPDAAGGLLANINRWRGQVGLEPVAEADLATTAQKQVVAGLPAWRVDFAGTPPGGDDVTRIIGAIVPVGDSAWFFKMMGPDAVVASQREIFDGMIASMRAVTPAMSSTTSAGPVREDATMPNDDVHAGVGAGAVSSSGVPGMPGMAGNVPPPPAAPTGFSFTAPPGWQEQPTTPFRVVNFIVPGAGVPAAEFYATPLSGAAGGALANVNRWRGQLGLSPVGEGDLPAMATSLEGPAGTFQIFDLASDSPALKTGERARMLVAILGRGNTTWFFRLTGEINHVAQQRNAFEAFLRSCTFATAP